jgi:hypothetical protein
VIDFATHQNLGDSNVQVMPRCISTVLFELQSSVPGGVRQLPGRRYTKWVLMVKYARNFGDGNPIVNALGQLRSDEGEGSSEIKLKPFPFSTHYAASGTTSPDGS